MNNDLISRKELKKTIQSDMDKVEQLTDSDKRWIKYFNDIIDYVPIVERPQGEWESEEIEIFMDNWQVVYTCNQCNKQFYKTFNFCPNCGADMRGKEE